MLHRQASLQTVTENKEKLEQGSSGCACCALAPAIAALVIVGQYDKDDSDCIGNYTIDLVTFLEVGAYIIIAWVGLSIVAGCIRYVLKENEELVLCINCCCLAIPGLCVVAWQLTWAGVGLSMYVNQMSDSCQDEPIAKMIFAWSLIPFCGIGLACCCCFIAICCGAIGNA
eukprot:UN03916